METQENLNALNTKRTKTETEEYYSLSEEVYFHILGLVSYDRDTIKSLRLTCKNFYSILADERFGATTVYNDVMKQEMLFRDVITILPVLEKHKDSLVGAVVLNSEKLDALSQFYQFTKKAKRVISFSNTTGEVVFETCGGGRDIMLSLSIPVYGQLFGKTAFTSHSNPFLQLQESTDGCIKNSSKFLLFFDKEKEPSIPYYVDVEDVFIKILVCKFTKPSTEKVLWKKTLTLDQYEGLKEVLPFYDDNSDKKKNTLAFSTSESLILTLYPCSSLVQYLEFMDKLCNTTIGLCIQSRMFTKYLVITKYFDGCVFSLKMSAVKLHVWN